MIAVDTNILVRYAVKDDRRQAASATAFLSKNRCFVLKTVLIEVAWVMSSPAGYNLPRQTVHDRILHILGLPKVEVEDAVNVAHALTWYRGGMDFADAMHLAGGADLAALATFDRKFSTAAEKADAFPPVLLLS